MKTAFCSRYDVMELAEDEWGLQTANGSWTGAIGMLHRKVSADHKWGLDWSHRTAAQKGEYSHNGSWTGAIGMLHRKVSADHKWELDWGSRNAAQNGVYYRSY